ncbi:MAG: hypothetical protein P8Y18_11390, partial [Candidatus Bathyarchaeota archaeon]
ARMITGIPGASYFFTIFHAIITSFSLLIYKGKRWRFFFQMVLLTFLIIPTYIGGIPFDLLSKTNLIVVAFIVDLVFNSLHNSFSRTQKLIFWSILTSVTFWLLNPLFGIIIKSILLFPPDYIERLIGVISTIFPIIIIEAIIGGWIGYKIFLRTSDEKTIISRL